MAKFDVVNKDTGETKVIEVSVHEIQQWYEDNQPWVRDWSQGCAGGGEIGDWRDTLRKKAPGWNDVLGVAASQRGSRVKKL